MLFSYPIAISNKKCQYCIINYIISCGDGRKGFQQVCVLMENSVTDGLRAKATSSIIKLRWGDAKVKKHLEEPPIWQRADRIFDSGFPAPEGRTPSCFSTAWHIFDSKNCRSTTFHSVNHSTSDSVLLRFWNLTGALSALCRVCEVEQALAGL